jgi:hypothetical protein
MSLRSRRRGVIVTSTVAFIIGESRVQFGDQVPRKGHGNGWCWMVWCVWTAYWTREGGECIAVDVITAVLPRTYLY